MASTTVLNIDADTGADIIKNEATPGLKMTNSGSGVSLELDKVQVTSPILAANATLVATTMTAASVASGALIAFGGNALVSLATIKFITGGAPGTKALRIVNSDGTFGWIPVLPDAAVTGLAL